MSLTTMNPLMLTTPPNNRVARAVELGGRIIRQAYKRYGELNDRKIQKKQRKTSSKKMKTKTMGSYGKGFYKGSFNPLKSNNVTAEEKALTVGSASTLENYGKAQGTEIVWIGATTFNLEELATNVSKAVVRKLLSKAGITTTNAEVVLQTHVDYVTGNPVDASGYQICLQVVNAGGTKSNVFYNFALNETLNSLPINCGLKDQILNYALASFSALSPTPQLITHCIKLYQTDNTASNDVGRLVATLNLLNEVVHYHSSIKLVVQNRTKGASTVTDNLDVIDAQPLKGMMYFFKKGSPTVRELPGVTTPPNTTSLMSRWPAQTVHLLSDTVAGYDQQLRNPPKPSFWQNCSKSANISLEPGDLKDVYLSNNIDMYYDKFIRSLAWITSGSGARVQKVGDTVFIALEERLNSGSANPIIVNYECETNMSCYLTTNRLDPMVKSFAVNQISM